jgi:hypothetical protein
MQFRLGDSLKASTLIEKAGFLILHLRKLRAKESAGIFPPLDRKPMRRID